MVKKLFALASVTALGGFVIAVSAAGCSSTETTTTATDASTDVAKKTDAKPPVPEEDAAPETTCLAPKPIDVSTIPYQPPAIKPGSCSKDVLTQISTFVDKNPNATFTDVKDEVSKDAKCGACVFGSVDDSSWAAIVLDKDGNGAINRGACVNVVSGNDACGKAYQQWTSCLLEACDKCTTDTERQTCQTDAQEAGAACGDASDALGKACGAKINTYISACRIGQYTWDAAITKLCIEGPKDGGTDADAN